MNENRELLNRIANEKIHVAISRKIVKTIASIPEKVKGIKPNRHMPTCLEILRTGYTDSIMEDIEQNVFLELASIASAGKVIIDTKGRLSFATEIKHDRQGKIKYVSAFVRLYKAVYNCLSQYRDNNSLKKIVNYGLDLTGINEEGETLSYTMKASNYMKEVAKQYDGHLTEILRRADIHDFFTALKADIKPVKFERLGFIFAGLCDGMKYDEIAYCFDLSLDMVKKGVSELRNAWKNYHFKVELSKQDFSTFGGSVKSYIKTGNNKTFHKVVNGLKIVTPNIDGIYKDMTAAYELMYNYGLFDYQMDNNPPTHKPQPRYHKWIPDKYGRGGKWDKTIEYLDPQCTIKASKF